MPEVRYFIVIQERQVKVWANTIIEAAEIANGAFNGHTEPGSGVINQIVSEVKETRMIVREDN
jgi:hypothetical protein